MLGAFDPAGTLRGAPLAIELTYCRADDPEWGAAEVRRIVAAGRVPLVTVEPWAWPDVGDGAAWQRALAPFHEGRLFVRFAHEANGTWYPWSRNPEEYRRLYRDWCGWMPSFVETVWSPNVAYPGSSPMADYWPGEWVDWVALDGYAWTGESFGEVFGASLAEVRRIAPHRPVMVAETAAPRGKGQAAYARDAARAVRDGTVQACVWLNTDKRGQGPDERDWRLSGPAARALLGRG